MRSRTLRHAADSAAEIAHAVDGVFATLDDLGAQLADAWSCTVARSGRYDSSDLAALQTAVFGALDARPTFDSAGFVLAEGTLADRTRHLDWWHRTEDGDYEFLLLNLDPSAPDCYDYYAMEWFVAAVKHRTRAVSGPLIDLPCADVSIMTFSTPIVAGEELLGIAGADVAVARFEEQIVPPLRALADQAVLVNHQRRVIASNDSTFSTGEKLATMPGSDDTWRTVLPVTHDLGWVLATGRP
jgi:hypothetical protein